MSLVGTRPPTVDEWDKYELHHRARLESITGKVPTKVLDPTFLVEFPKMNVTIKKPYILFYYCEKLPIKIKKQIFQYAKTNGLRVYGAGECDKEYSDIKLIRLVSCFCIYKIYLR